MFRLEIEFLLEHPIRHVLAMGDSPPVTSFFEPRDVEPNPLVAEKI